MDSVSSALIEVDARREAVWPLIFGGCNEVSILSVGQEQSQQATGNAPPGYRVLIVEDNPHIIEMYSYVLKKLAANELKGTTPLEVHFAADGHAALALLTESSFQLVMTDLYMPVMDGFQLIEKIRSEPTLKGVPVVAISAGGQDAKDRAMKLGVTSYLKKPVRFADVMDTVKQLLRIT
jgi:CheY-like chemotaxis protein